MKRTLLDDFMKIFSSLECKGIKFTCKNCCNKAICDIIEDLIKSMEKHY